MLRNLNQMEGRPLHASDGEIGEVKDFFFDTDHWRVRYFIADTGEWLNSRRVMIAPEVLRTSQPDPHALSVDLTIDQVRHSPDIDMGKPVSPQEEKTLRRHYGWPDYWGGLTAAAGSIIAAAVNTLGPGSYVNVERSTPPAVDPHLRSANQTKGYRIEATDGSIGHVEDFLVDEKNWRIRYLVVDTRNWWPGGNVVVAPEWIANVSWETRTVSVDLTREQIEASPPYGDAVSLIDPEYAARLHDHYGRPRYADWDEQREIPQ
jgi:uncharacterized protein YrrD